MTSTFQKCEWSMLIADNHLVPLKYLLSNLTIFANAKWDRLENQPKWLCPPGIIDWLKQQMEDKMSGEIQVSSNHMNFMKNHFKLIPFKNISNNWTQRSLKNLPSQFRMEIIGFMQNYLHKNYNLN